MLKTGIFIKFFIHIIKKGRLSEPACYKLFQLAEFVNRDFLLLERNNLTHSCESLLVLYLIENSAALLLL